MFFVMVKITQVCDEKIVGKVSGVFYRFLDADFWKNNEKIPSRTVSSQIAIYFNEFSIFWSKKVFFLYEFDRYN